jgi:hypothetical protein
MFVGESQVMKYMYVYNSVIDHRNCHLNLKPCISAPLRVPIPPTAKHRLSIHLNPWSVLACWMLSVGGDAPRDFMPQVSSMHLPARSASLSTLGPHSRRARTFADTHKSNS